MISLRYARSFVALALLLAMLAGMVGSASLAAACGGATTTLVASESPAASATEGACSSMATPGSCCCGSEIEPSALSTRAGAGAETGCDCAVSAPEAPLAPALAPARLLLAFVWSIVFGAPVSLPLSSLDTGRVRVTDAVLPPQIAPSGDTPPRAPPVCS